ncbi:MAG: hypothetical protein ACOC22_00770 [bacterium]
MNKNSEKQSREDRLREEMEQQENVNSHPKREIPNSPPKEAKLSNINEEQAKQNMWEEQKELHEDAQRPTQPRNTSNQENNEYKSNSGKVGSPIQDTSSVKKPWEHNQEKISMANQIGWQKIPTKELPSQGLFYPEDTEVVIRAATAAEIRHWSTLDESDPSQLDDMLNYILERCAVIKFPNYKSTSWKDIKEVDRFYILLAIREYTFINGENNLQVRISESKNVDVTKEMIDYITFDDKLMKYYDNEKRCFVLNFKDGTKLEITLPSVGVTQWLKNYVQRKQNRQEAIDQDFLSYAPFVIHDWRGLNDTTYEQMVSDSYDWTTVQVSMLNEIRKIFVDSVEPKIKYTEESGGQREIPLNFRGGIKSLFLISDPFGQLA